MKKTVKYVAVIMACLIMVSFCSCNGNKDDKSGGDKIKVTAEEDEGSGSKDTKAASAGKYSDSTIGQLLQISNDALGKDAETAEKMIGEFFNAELKDRMNGIMTDERAGIATVMRVYIQLLQKDDLRFNGMQMWTDEKDGHVRRIEYFLTLDGYNCFQIDDTPEFRDEIKKLFTTVNDELKTALGNAFLSDKLVGDDDSFFYAYNVPEKLFASVEIRDFTEPGGNGLLKTTLIFADEKVLLD